MKQIVVFFSIFGLFATVSYSQELGAGLKAGLNFADQVCTGEGQDVISKTRMGFHAGGYANYYVNDDLAAQIELLISEKGSKWSDAYFDGEDKLLYIEFPILIKYRVYKFIGLHAGPQISYLLDAKNISKDGQEMDAKERYKDTEIDFTFGVEANFPYNINLTARYALGLSAVTTDVEYWEPWRNNTFQISVGYRLTGK